MNSPKQGPLLIQNFLKAFSQTIEDYLNKFRLFLNSLNDPEVIERILTGIQKYTEQFSEGTKLSIFILSQHGWFISLEMPPSKILECATSALEGEIDKVDNIMASFFRYNAGEINKALNSNFPNRSNILDNAFNAHRRGEYDLSVPVFLIQTDGICNELIGIEMFGRRNNKPKTSAYVDQFEQSSFLSALLEPFRVCLPLTASEKERELLTIENYLNRHEILHGAATNYGTELNSLKALSLINFVSTVLQKVKQNN